VQVEKYHVARLQGGALVLLNFFEADNLAIIKRSDDLKFFGFGNILFALYLTFNHCKKAPP